MGLGVDDQHSGISGGFAGHTTNKMSKHKRCTRNGTFQRHSPVAEKRSHAMMNAVEQKTPAKAQPAQRQHDYGVDQRLDHGREDIVACWQRLRVYAWR